MLSETISLSLGWCQPAPSQTNRAWARGATCKLISVRCSFIDSVLTAGTMMAASEPALTALVRDGCGADAAGEDRFDCLLGVLCVLNVLAGNRPDTAPDDCWLGRWEGWVLGQIAMPLPLK